MNDLYRENQKSSLATNLLQYKNKKTQRNIFGREPYEKNRLVVAKSDSVLEAKARSSFPKIASTSALIRNKVKRQKSHNVSFNPRIAVFEYQKSMEFYARDDW